MFKLSGLVIKCKLNVTCLMPFHCNVIYIAVVSAPIHAFRIQRVSRTSTSPSILLNSLADFPHTHY